MKYLNATLNLRDICKIYNHAEMFDLKELLQTTSEFMDRNASKILQSEDFLVLSSDALVKLISRNSFCSDEMNIFKGMVNDTFRPVVFMHANLLQIISLLNSEFGFTGILFLVTTAVLKIFKHLVHEEEHLGVFCRTVCTLVGSDIDTKNIFF